MIEEDANDRYDRVRCRCCGCNWLPFKDEHGRIFAGHPYGETCSRYRPREAGAETSGYIHAEIVHAGGNGEVS